MAKRTVYVIDDEEPIRKALKLMLTVQGHAVTLFNSGPSLLDVVDALVPGCLLLDVRMPEMDGIEVQQRLADRGAAHPVVVMTGHGDLAVAVAALQNGAVAFVEKPFTKSALLQALSVAFLKLEDAEGYVSHLAAATAAVERLRADDRAVLGKLAAGRSNEKIAAELGLSPAMVEVRRARLLVELGAEHVSDLLRIAFAAGLGSTSEGYATLPRDA